MQYYDSDKKIPVFGFGARLPPHLNVVSHCFALNGDIFSPEVLGISGVLEVYRKTLSEIAFHGPTVFSELISTVIHYASAEELTQENQQYFILLIITDGEINDIDNTINEIIRSGKFPISIVIVGVGNDDFKNMSMLDADEEPLKNKKTGEVMTRDIVQFVPYSKLKADPEALAREVLCEIPYQLVDFMENKNIKPNILSKTEEDEFFRKKHEKVVSGCNDDLEFLEKERKKFINSIIHLGFEEKIITKALKNGIACKSIELAIELINYSINPKRKYLKDLKFELCKKCCEKKNNCFNESCGHFISCNNCIQYYDKCLICRTPIVNWKIIDI